MRDEIYVGALISEDYLMHHGIHGMKWGVRHGPPYPLDASVSKDIKDGKRVRIARGKSGEVDLHNKKGSKKEGYIMAFNLVRDIATLNPVGLAMDAQRLGQYTSSKMQASKTARRQKNEPIDEKTGFHKKIKPMSMDEDARSVNPDFHNFNSNTKNNCMLCTATYDMRRRGYDVTANLAGKGYTYSALKEWYPDAKIVDIAGSNQNAAKTAFIGDKTLIQNTKSAIEKQPNGARGNLMVQWATFQGGHSMAYEVIDGKMHIFDGQTGKHYTNPDKILKQCREVSFARLDDIEPDYNKIKECCR
jgi:hypothetical protein